MRNLSYGQGGTAKPNYRVQNHMERCNHICFIGWRHRYLKNVYPKRKEKKITDWKKPKTFLLPNFVKDASKVSEFILGR